MSVAYLFRIYRSRPFSVTTNMDQSTLLKCHKFKDIYAVLSVVNWEALLRPFVMIPFNPLLISVL